MDMEMQWHRLSAAVSLRLDIPHFPQDLSPVADRFGAWNLVLLLELLSRRSVARRRMDAWSFAFSAGGVSAKCAIAVFPSAATPNGSPKYYRGVDRRLKNAQTKNHGPQNTGIYSQFRGIRAPRNPFDSLGGWAILSALVFRSADPTFLSASSRDFSVSCPSGGNPPGRAGKTARAPQERI